jgi:hypothetical protein
MRSVNAVCFIQDGWPLLCVASAGRALRGAAERPVALVAAWQSVRLDERCGRVRRWSSEPATLKGFEVVGRAHGL